MVRIDSYFRSLESGFVLIVINVLISISLTPFIIKHIGGSDYGFYIVAIGLIQFLSIFNFGFGSAFEIMVSRNTKNKHLLSQYKNIILIINIAIGLIGLFLGIYVSYNLNIIGLNPSSKFSLSIIFFSLSALIVLITNVFKSIIIGYKKIYLLNKVGVFSSLLGALSTYVFIKNNTGLIGLNFNFLIIEIIRFFLLMYFCDSNLPKLEKLSFNFDRKQIKDLYKIGIYIFLGSISILFLERMDNIFTAKIINLSTVSALVVSSKIFEISKKIIFMISNNLRPYFGNMFENNDYEAANLIFISTRHIVIISSIITAIFIIQINPYFIKFWMGSDTLYVGNNISFCLGLNFIYFSWRSVTRAYLTSGLVVKEQTFFSIFEGLGKIILVIFLGYKFGLIGIVISTFASGFVLQLLFYGYILNKKGFEKIHDYTKAQLNLILQLIFFIFTFWFFNKILQNFNNIYETMLFISLTTIFNIFFGYIFNRRKINAIISYKNKF